MKLAIVLAFALASVSSVAATSKLTAVSSDELVWAANAAYRTYESRKSENKFLAYIIVNSYKADPGLDPIALMKTCNTFKGKINELREGNNGSALDADALRWSELLYETFARIPQVSAYVVPFSIVHSAASALYRNSLAADEQVVSQLLLQNRVSSIRDISDDVWKDLHALGNGIPHADLLVDTVLSQEIGVSVKANAAAVLASNPGFEALSILKDSLGADGRLTMDMDKLEQKWTENQAKTHREIREATGAIQVSDKRQQDLLGYLKNKAEQEAQSAKEAARAALNQKLADERIAAARAANFVISSLVGFTDPALGNSMATVGGVIIDLKESIDRFGQSVEGFEKFATNFGANAGGLLSAGVLTGDILSAGLKLMSLMIGGKSPEQLILEEIREVRMDIAKLATDMALRFDRIDQQLGTIYQVLSEGMLQLEYAAGEESAQAKAIQKRLLSMQARLDRMEGNILAEIETGFKRDLAHKRAQCLDAENYNPRSRMPYAQYADCALSFAHYATESAADEVASAQGAQNMMDGALANQLAKPVERNLNLLADLAKNRFGNFNMMRGGPLVNPVEWAVGAEAFLALLSSRREFSRLTTTYGLDRMILEGQRVQSMLAGITVDRTLGKVAPNQSFIASITSNYLEKAAKVTEQLTVLEQSYANDPRNGTGGLPLWWNDKTSLTSEISSPIAPCDPQVLARTGGHPAVIKMLHMTPPALLGSLLPPQIGALQRAKHGGLGVCWVEQVAAHRENGGHCFTRSRIRIRGTFEGHPVFDRTFTTPEHMFPELCGGWITTDGQFRDPPLAGFHPEPIASILTSRFSSEAQELLSPAELAATSQWSESELLRVLAQHRLSFHSKVLESLTESSDLAAALQELTGAKAVVDTFVSLGFSRTLRSNDLLASLIYGSQGLMGELELKAWLRGDQSGENLGNLGQILADRARAFNDLIQKVMKTNGTEAEPKPLIDATLSRLVVARDRLKADQPKLDIATALKRLRKRLGDL